MTVFRKGEAGPAIDPSVVCGCKRGLCHEPRLHSVTSGREADALRIEISGELAGIKDQLMQTAVDRRRGNYADGDWFRRTNTAKAFKGRQLQWLAMLGKDLRESERQTRHESHEERRDGKEAIFRKLLRAKIGDDAYISLREEAERMAMESAPTVSSNDTPR